jgi:hypothetical protein
LHFQKEGGSEHLLAPPFHFFAPADLLIIERLLARMPNMAYYYGMQGAE